MQLSEKPQQFLDIEYARTCDCPPNHINCLTAKEWMQHQIAVWEFYYEKRDIRDKKIHPAVFPIALPAKCIRLFTHKGELVLDPFAGVGTTLVAAQDLGRNAVGFDLQPHYIDLCERRLGQVSLFSRAEQIAIQDDARNIPTYLEPETTSLIWTLMSPSPA